MNIPYEQPAAHKHAFNCPRCRAYAKQVWLELTGSRIPGRTLQAQLAEPIQPTYRESQNLPGVYASKCAACGDTVIWNGAMIIWPRQTPAPPANPDLPEDIRKDYDEAATIMGDSPRGAAALLRLAVQKLCEHLGAKGDSLGDYIKKWAATGLDRRVEKAFDTVRVVGNNAVHAGKIDVDDHIATVEMLFFLVNYIAEKQISEPKRIDDHFEKTVPEDEKAKIERRNRPSA